MVELRDTVAITRVVQHKLLTEKQTFDPPKHETASFDRNDQVVDQTMRCKGTETWFPSSIIYLKDCKLPEEKATRMIPAP